MDAAKPSVTISRADDSVYPFIDIYSNSAFVPSPTPAHDVIPYDEPVFDPVPTVVVLSPRASLSRAPAVPVDVNYDEDPEEAQ